ncbi:MAG: Do family serine endopeptidase [Rhodobacteraceae bacterium]|nr:Do family serine endopeptidase [Paracoccaceae bacterium]
MKIENVKQVSTRLRSRRARLLAGVMALGVAGVLSVQTIVPNQFAMADPVSVKSAGPVDFSPVVQAVSPAVVSVQVKREIKPRTMSFNGSDDFLEGLPEDHPLYRFFRRFGGEGSGKSQKPLHKYGTAQGSGFFISEDGYLVTNNHVVEDGSEFTVINSDGDEYDAKLIGTDPRTDLALLKVDTDHDLTYVKFSDDAPSVGEWVVAVGNPFGLGGTVTAGIVSARGRDIGAGPYDDFIQIDAPVNRGNSGGPAFNMKGEVIGVNAAIYSPSGGNVGIAFAIPSSTATDIIADLKKDGSVERGWLGVQIQAVSDDIAESIGLKKAAGAIVAEAQDGSPAEKAGLKAGDAIIKVDGIDIKDPKALSKMIAGYAPDSKVDVTVWRDGGEEEIAVTLGALEDPQQMAAVTQSEDGTTSLDDLGLELTTAKVAGVSGEGVVIADVDPDSAAAEKGLRPGDRITEVGGTAVKTPADVVKAMLKADEEGRKAVLLRVETERSNRFVALPTNKVG